MYLKISVLIFLVVSIGDLSSRPQYTVLTGNRCIACHSNAQGSGLRNTLGSYSRNQTSLIDINETGIGDFFKNAGEYNSFGEETFTWGLDFRLQSAKTSESERDLFAMQLSPYIAVKPFDWLTLQGSVNLMEAEFAGQQIFTASVTIKPSYEYPELRFGFIKPTIGNLFDDHTLLIKQTTDEYYSNQIMPPDYAELGAELSYDYFKWLNITAGLYSTNSMNEITLFDKNFASVNIVGKNELFKLVRVAFLPRFFENYLNTHFGAAHYFTSDYSITDLFVHLGLTDEFSLIAEYVMTNKKDMRESNNYLVELTYQIMSSLMVYIRYEDAKTKDIEQAADFKANRYTIGLNIYPFPFIELRPEYRIMDRMGKDADSRDWAAQLHIYY
jgi:hypothetical protein